MVDGVVTTVAADGAGGWYIAGGFTSVGGTPRDNLAHLLPNGTVDANWDANVDGVVYGLGVVGNTVYVGGDFNQAGVGAGLAALDASGER
jgi:hypothetical protein